MDSILKIQNPKRSLRDEKHITQHICWLFGDYYNLSYDDLVEKFKVNQHKEYAVSFYNDDWIPLMWIWQKIVDDYWTTLSVLSTSI